MKDYKTFFAGKKITLMGLGLLGRGVGDARFLASLGAILTVTDIKTEAQLLQSLKELSGVEGITFHLGGHVLADFEQCDMVVKAAGVPLNSPFIAEAKKRGIPVRMSSDLFAEFAEVTTVGVTGTRGKTTTSHMIAYSLQKVGKRVLLGGNVRGVSTLSLLPLVTPDTTAVLELDSWQLQGFGEAHLSPHVAVFTNLMPDHQNYYPSMQEYFDDKSNIFKFQKTGDTLIVGAAIAPDIIALHPPVTPMVPEPIPTDWNLQVIGVHNRENASLAREALFALGLSIDDARRGIESFEAVEGRLQFVGKKNEVRIYNDNNATTPEATCAALQALGDTSKNIVLLCGGADKQLPLEQLVSAINDNVKTVVLLPGTGTDRLRPLLPHNVQALESKDLAEAVHLAVGQSHPGDILLFSPGFASFGLFKNEYDRNDQFNKLVSAL